MIGIGLYIFRRDGGGSVTPQTFRLLVEGTDALLVSGADALRWG